MSFGELLSAFAVAGVVGGVYFEWRLASVWSRLQTLEQDEPVQHEAITEIRERLARLEERTK